jgi:S-adenosylhomocysteine hydrolase
MDPVLSGENWQPNMILDDGGDATHVMVKKYPAVFKLLKVFLKHIFITHSYESYAN